MKYLFTLLVISVLLCVSCESSSPEEKYSSFFSSEKDSLVIVNEVFDSLKIELNQFTAELNSTLVNERSDFPTICGKRRGFTIVINQKNEILIKNRFPIIELDSIKPAILEYYQTNAQKNDRTNHFPMYSEITLGQIKTRINESKQNIDRLKEEPKTNADFIELRKEQINEWEKRKK